MLSEDGSVMACALDSTDIAAEIERIHAPSAVVTAALGRLAAAASMIGFSLKGKDDTVTIRIDGGGPAGRLIAGCEFLRKRKSLCGSNDCRNSAQRGRANST